MGCRAHIVWFCVGLVHCPPPSAAPPDHLDVGSVRHRVHEDALVNPHGDCNFNGVTPDK